MTTTVTDTTAFALTTTRRVLADALDTVGLAIATRPSVPVLAGVLITGYDDGTATLTGFDYHTAITVTLPETVQVPGRVVVSHAELKGVLSATAKGTPKRKADAAPVTFAVDDGTPSVTVDGYTVPFEAYPTDDYPILPDAPPTLASVDRERFVRELGRVTVATIGADWNLPVLETVRLEASGHQMSMVATDRYRLVWSTLPTVPATTEHETGVVLAHGKTLAKLTKKLTGDTVRLGVTDDLLAITCGDVRVLIRGYEEVGNFPKYRWLFPDTVPVTVTADRADLLTATVRGRGILKAKRENALPLAMAVTPDTVTVSPDLPGPTVSPEMSAKTDGVAAGELLRFRFNPEFLEDALSSVTSDTVTLHASSTTKPVVVTDGDEDVSSAAYRHLLMPIRPTS
ncbi:DNA polymerase III subunit beta [Nocardiopsis quinghaiensis]|uniref:DNA polymerase III subunit beta n=1 Tax=Nocardiopsis quinghaiensis TaxID=464995 RepID=UPI00123B41FE|nr:DNA polymerase III subunit beta [Nocardiopsis quinghaiensis]